MPSAGSINLIQSLTQGIAILALGKSSSDTLPELLCGPILRHTESNQVTVWLVTSQPSVLGLTIQTDAAALQLMPHADSHQQTVPVGERAFIHLLTIETNDLLSGGQRYFYRVLSQHQQHWTDIVDTPDELYYNEDHAFHFHFQPTLKNVFHGSCRKPHYTGKDALAQLDSQIADPTVQRPDLLLLSGDQIYADDVAGPMLHAVRQTITLLGLHHEPLEGATIASSADLDGSPDGFYLRENMLPKTEDNSLLSKVFFNAKQKPIFTSVNAKNHLIALSEMLAMYLLVWSPVIWRYVSIERPAQVPEQYHDMYEQEKRSIGEFASELGKVARALAHVPTYMIFDDHDVSDDWNLTRQWEETVYSHPLSKRMIGNALSAYWLCQGWGNQPKRFASLFEQAQHTFTPNSYDNLDEFNQHVLDWNDWHYCLHTSPAIYVMDTRTQRWRSESNPSKPSGLLDWEALCEFQQTILGKESVIVVSAAPIYGLKFIEAVQKAFTACGQALMVDAENWMAHKGTAEVILNIFRHLKTPPKFIILSGDVHYSFVYDVTLRFRRNSPEILQFTCSGLKNTFPTKLLRWFERCNRLLYAKRSPLNFFTRRRNMRIDERDPKPDNDPDILGHVVNTPAIGQLKLADNGEPTECNVITADGRCIRFEQDN